MKRRRSRRATDHALEAPEAADGRFNAALDALGAKLLDREWRLRNLYWITDKSGARVRFVPNWAQVELFETLTHRNVDLKVRQLGVTTGYCILWLDAVLFNRGLRVGIVAHTKDDAAIGTAFDFEFGSSRSDADKTRALTAAAKAAAP